MSKTLLVIGAASLLLASLVSAAEPANRSSFDIVAKVASITNRDGSGRAQRFTDNDQLDGPYASWWDNGALKEQGQFQNGSRVGVYRWFTQNGQL